MVSTVTAYDNFFEDLGKGLINMSTDTFKVILVTSSYTFNSSHNELADITGELTSGNGYTTGGATIANPTWAFASGVTKYDGDNVSWSASGGAIGPVTGAIIYDDTSTGDKLMCYMDFGGEQTAGDSTDFKVTFDDDGIFSVEVDA